MPQKTHGSTFESTINTGKSGNFEPRFGGSVHQGMCCRKVRRREKGGDKNLYKGVIIGCESWAMPSSLSFHRRIKKN